MEKRTLTITLQSDWKSALRESGLAAKGSDYQGETLNFETPATFFSHLTERRWIIINALQKHHTMGVRELARYVERDVKRVHEDAQALVKLGLIEKCENGALHCPFADIHVDMHIMSSEEVA